MKRRKEKSKGEKKRYTHWNAEFQRKARRDQKAFLCDQCKEIEENNRIGNTRGLLKVKSESEVVQSCPTLSDPAILTL